jgi:hypothetical protein
MSYGMKKGDLVSDTKMVVAKGSESRSRGTFKVQWLQNLQRKIEGTKKKKKCGFPLVFRNRLSSIPNLGPTPLGPGVREPISVVIAIDLSRKKKEVYDAKG